MKDKTRLYELFNSLVFLVLFITCEVLIFVFLDLLIMKIILSVVAFLLCGYLERWVLSKYVNAFVKNFFWIPFRWAVRMGCRLYYWELFSLRKKFAYFLIKLLIIFIYCVIIFTVGEII